MDAPSGVMAGEGGVAPLAELREEEAFDADGESRARTAGGGVERDLGAAALDGDGALARGRHHAVQRDRLEHEAWPAGDAEAVQAGSGQVGGISVALGELLEARVDVAAQFGPLRLREGEGALGAATRAAGRDELRRRDVGSADQHVARVLPR
jgi:hypothetical protein